MDAICGVTKELLAELMGKHGELKAKFGERLGEREFEQYLASRGLDIAVFASAHNGWWERFRADPTGRAEAEFHMLLQGHAQRAHFGDVRDMSGDAEEGITLDQYAQITVAVSRQGADIDAIVRNFGLRDGAHWQRANAAWTQRMGADTTHKLSMQFGQLYQKYAGPSFREELVSQTAAILAESNKPKDVVKAPDEPLTPDLCVRNMQSPSRAERWKYAGHYAHMADTNNVPDKAAAVATVTPILVEMIEQHDDHTTNAAERAVRQLWDLGVRTGDVRGAAARCMNRGRDKLQTLQAAFAPIQDKAVPERVALQARIQDYTSLVETMEDYFGREWSAAITPAASAQLQAPPVVVPTRRSSGLPRWLLAPVLIAAALGGVFVLRSRTADAGAPAPAPDAVAVAPPAAMAVATATAPAVALPGAATSTTSAAAPQGPKTAKGGKKKSKS
jgi:hypothetical protein